MPQPSHDHASPTIVHGGDLDAARRRFPGAPLPWIDLSTGINPRPYPFDPPAASVWQRLPDAGARVVLEAAAALAYGAEDPAQVVAAPGTQALIHRLPAVWPARRVAVLGFGYQEHPAVWRAAGAEVAVVDTAGALSAADVAVVVNPNNPDGRTIRPEVLRGIAAELAARGGLLIVDEAFTEVADPGLSLVPHLPAEGVVVLRSFGKFFGLAGLRLGFAVAGPALAARFRTALGPWAVSGPALAIGAAALRDTGWQAVERRRLAADAARLDALLSGAGFERLGGTPLFRLVAHSRAWSWFDHLGRAGILVRRFEAEPSWLRVGLPGDEAGWRRLADALAGKGSPSAAPSPPG